MLALLAWCWLYFGALGANAFGEEPDEGLSKEAQVTVGDDGIPDVVVRPEAWSRWDGTRWRVDVQMMLPMPSVFYAEKNFELQFVAVDLHYDLYCELGERLTRRNHEVECVIQDAALRVAPWQRNLRTGAPPKTAQAVLDETVDRLRGLDVLLQVLSDGRVVNVGLPNKPQRVRRLNTQYENLRQLVMRSLVGFHMRTPDSFRDGDAWVERGSTLMHLPSFQYFDIGAQNFGSGVGGPNEIMSVDSPGAAGMSGSVLDVGGGTDSLAGTNAMGRYVSPASFGQSRIRHEISVIDGRFIVQSTGQGTYDLGDEVQLSFSGRADAVSVFEPDYGIMTERVWAVRLHPTAGSRLAQGVRGWPYMLIGRLAWVDLDAELDLGESVLVTPPGSANRGNLPPWPTPR